MARIAWKNERSVVMAFLFENKKGLVRNRQASPLFFAVLWPKSLKARLSLAGARWWHTANRDVEDLAGGVVVYRKFTYAGIAAVCLHDQ